MWGRRAKGDVVAQSLAEAQTVRGLIGESDDLLADIQSEIDSVLSAASRALLAVDEGSPLLTR